MERLEKRAVSEVLICDGAMGLKLAVAPNSGAWKNLSWSKRFIRHTKMPVVILLRQIPFAAAVINWINLD
jgi:methionine synthase I (cobalamin-dependent)